MESKKIYIVDLIGIHSGMHYYNDSFRKELEKIEGVQVQILSNYSDSGKAFIPNIYKGPLAIKIIKLIYAWIKILLFSKNHKKAKFIYMHFGRKIDIPFLKIASKSPSNWCIDIHDFYSIENDLSLRDRSKINRQFQLLEHVIYHSDTSSTLLDKTHFKGRSYFVPHFALNTPKKGEQLISANVVNSIKKDRINILFFGHIRESKGILDLIRMLQSMKSELVLKEFNFIIAGRDNSRMIQTEMLKDLPFSVVNQYLNDAEAAFLFEHSAYCILPYREITQSGVLEMGINFNCPLLLSDIPPFREILSNYPSFGHLISLVDASAFNDLLVTIVSKKNHYFDSIDIKKYAREEEFSTFRTTFSDQFLLTTVN